ncbi:MAG TPA: hypothetical protein PKE64_24255 [Anaerolineae bacterium]|nr:hypothetical protein [Anaerolineae bacterium]
MILSAKSLYSRSPLTEAVIDIRVKLPESMTLEGLAELNQGQREAYQPRSIPRTPRFFVEPDEDQAKANQVALTRLDNLKQTLPYEPLSTPVMLKAAEFWARMRAQGQPTADSQALDADVTLAAQAALLGQQGDRVVIATTNVGHLSRMVPDYLWQEIG